MLCRSFWSNNIYIPNNNTKLITKPIRPEASTKEKPINEKRNKYSFFNKKDITILFLKIKLKENFDIVFHL